MKTLLLKLYKRWTLSGIKDYDNNVPDIKAWKDFINGLPEGDDITQSYNKYLCRMYYFGTIYKLFVNFSSLFLLLFLIPYSLLKKTYPKKKNVDAVFIIQKNLSYETIVPSKLVQEYSNIEHVLPDKKELKLSKEFRAKFMSVWKRYFFHPFYVYLVFKDLAYICYLSDMYNPRAIISYIEERNIASPLITSILENKDKKYISFMHGDYVFQIIQSFMSFSEYYVWSEDYIEMFKTDLRCDIRKYVVYRPKKYEIIFDNSKEKRFYLTYYLGWANKETLNKIYQLIHALDAKGKKCVLRPHPRASDMDLIKNVFPEEYLQSTDLSIKESVEITEYVCALNSTVLYEAYYGGMKILLDDVVDKPYFENLKDRNYNILNKDHRLLSDILKENDVMVNF